jgi:hypothetical protein
LEFSLAAVGKHAARSDRPGVISATSFGIKHSSSLLDKSNGSYEDCPDLDAIAYERRELFGMFSGLVTGKPQCSTQYLCSAYSIEFSKDWIVYEVSTSEVISIPLSHFLNDRNCQTESRICAEMRSIPVVAVTSV